jgi:hypothetical protein
MWETQPMKLRAAIRRFFLRLAVRGLVLLLILGGIAIWRPDWRIAAQRWATPYVERAAAPVMERGAALLDRAARPMRERAGAWRREVGTPGAGERPTPKAGPASEPPVTTGAQSPDAEPPSAPPAEVEPITPAGNLPPRLPALAAPRPLPPALRTLRAASEAHPSAAAYRRLADAAAGAGFPDLAAYAYQHEAQVYRRLGDPNAAVVEEMKAGRYRAEGRLFLHAPEPPPASLQTRQRLEPPSGCYLGAFIDRDDDLGSSYTDENWQTHRDAADFAERTGKPHATLFCYLSYGKPFPRRWAERLRDAGIIPHIAWEPDSLAAVNEDAKLLSFADALARFDAPIFIRFAGEMNGDWTPYHNDPALYRQKFRLVHRVLTQRAPKAALIWCVNNIPDATIDAYYPGDDAVDWVGVNFYNVLFFDNDSSRPADHVHPVDLLQAVYARYAARKPIAICEYAASHQAAVDPRPRPEAAILRMRQLYAALPRLFPRVKLIDWFDCNNLRHARPDRQLNNYSLTDDPAILAAYREAIAPDHFLGRPAERPRTTIRAPRENEKLSGVVTLSAWVRSHLDRPRVYLLADDQVLYAGDVPGAAVCRWDTRKASPGAHTLRLVVTESDGRLILEERRRVRT